MVTAAVVDADECASGRMAAHDVASTIPSLALPPSVGLGVRQEHAGAWLAGIPEVGFAEIHAENYMMRGGPALELLSHIASDYALSIHGVALSLGGEDPIDQVHLKRVAELVGRLKPASFSEHLAWSRHDGIYLNDLLPIAYDSTTLARVTSHIHQVQDALKMPLLLENPSTYISFASSTWDEVDFLDELASRTGCGLLLDVNNVAVSAHNHGYSARDYIDRFPIHRVGEIHVAGHHEQSEDDGGTVLIDSHGSPVADNVWQLLDRALTRGGPLPVLLERDNDVPPIKDLHPEIIRIKNALVRAEAVHAQVP